MSGRKPSYRWAMLLAVTLAFIFADLEHFSMEDVDGYSVRSNLVRVDTSTLSYATEPFGMDSYNPHKWYYYGEVNRTTRLRFELINNNGAPFSDIRVNYTVYWFDGALTDNYRVLHKDQTFVDIGPGKGTRSTQVVFDWIPRFAGSYMWNVSVFVPGDAFPVSDYIYGVGVSLKTGGNNVFYPGFWVGTYSTDCSSIEGWSAESLGGSKEFEWHVTDHDYTKEDPTLHSIGGAFWMGNLTTGIGPSSGIYSLISPALALDVFDHEAYSPEFKDLRPQIYLNYKYRGNVTGSGPSGDAGIFHYISVDDGMTWMRLLDPKGSHVRVWGNTSSPIWNNMSHESPLGGWRWGLDLSSYAGQRIRIKLEYRPSGFEETGYLIDDIVLVGKQKVDISTFSVERTSYDRPSALPGSRIDYGVRVTSVGRSNRIIVRGDAVSSSPYMEPSRDMGLSDPVITLEAGNTMETTFSIYLPANAPSGPGFARVRFVSENTIRDMVFEFTVEEVRDLKVEVRGQLEGEIGPDDPVMLTIHLSNEGNRDESVDLRFCSYDDIRLEIDDDMFPLLLRPGQELLIDTAVKTSSDRSGERIGFIVWTDHPITDPDDLVLESILSNDIDPGLRVIFLNYTVPHFHEISLMAQSTRAVITDPPMEGSSNITFYMNLLNLGNGDDIIRLTWELEQPDVNISVSIPSEVRLRVGSMDTVVPVIVTVDHPISSGNYRFKVHAISSGSDESERRSIGFEMIIGSEEVPNGVYLSSSSLVIEPERTIMGAGSIITFRVQSFGLPDKTEFTVRLRSQGEVLSSATFQTSRTGSVVCQMGWAPQSGGPLNMTLSIDDAFAGKGSGEFVSRINISLFVWTIDVGLEWKKVPLDGDVDELEPGRVFIEVLVTNSGDTSADIIPLMLEIRVGNGTKSYFNNITTPLQPGESEVRRFGPIDIAPESRYILTVRTTDDIRWRDPSPEDNTVTRSFTVGVAPPGEPIWRNTTFLIVSGAVILTAIIVIYGLLYRRK